MSERDTQLEVAFDDFATATRPHVRPPGVAHAQATARRRRRNRMVVGSLAVVLIMVPAAALAIMRSGPDGNPPPVSPPTGAPSPAVTATPSLARFGNRRCSTPSA